MNSDHESIERQLDRILSAADFVAAPKMRELLRYLVDATRAGDPERLKGYAIGVDVFDRGTAFDPAADPIVRVQAGRLRKLLDAYYSGVGHADDIRIAIPKGAYTVEISDTSADVSETEGAAKAPSEVRPVVVGTLVQYLAVLAATLVIAVAALWLITWRPIEDRADYAQPPPVDTISVAVLPFVNMSRDASKSAFSDGLTDALTTALARVKSISIPSRTSASQYREAKDLRVVGKELGVRYLIEGALQHDGQRMRVNVQLIDAVTGAHLWAHTYDRDAGDELAVQSDLVATLAAELRPQLFNAAKRAMKDDPMQTATAWQLYIQSTWIPGEARNSLEWEKERVVLARRALELEPDLGPAHSVLADKLAYLATVDPPSDSAAARDEAGMHARRTLELSPGDPDAVFNVSVHHWHAGQIAKSVELLNRTLELDPNHVLARFLVKAVPFTCSPAPRRLIDELAAFDANMSADNPVRWVTLAWIAQLHLQDGDLVRAADAAKRSAQIFQTPNTVFLLAAILVQLGDKKAAADELAQQKQNWPNLDAAHYAGTAIPRRCSEVGPGALRLQKTFRDLAEAVTVSALP